jgi:hypothetical protein
MISTVIDVIIARDRRCKLLIREYWFFRFVAKFSARSERPLSGLSRGVYPPEAMEQTSPPVKNLTTFFVPHVSGFSFLLSSLACFILTLPSLPLTFIDGGPGCNPGKKFFEIMLACRRVLAHFGRKNPVFDEPTKFSPLFRLKVFPLFFSWSICSRLYMV